MVNRCTSKTSNGFVKYGAKGVTVCDRWRTFDNFLADMGEKPIGTSIDRIDNKRGYEPENCRWATITQQNRNKSNVTLTLEKVRAIRELYAAGGISQKAVAARFGISQGHVCGIVKGRKWASE